jgi:hypothetical protein
MRFGAGGGGMSAPAALRFVSAEESEEPMLRQLSGGSVAWKDEWCWRFGRKSNAPGLLSCKHGGGYQVSVWSVCLRKVGECE